MSSTEESVSSGTLQAHQPAGTAGHARPRSSPEWIAEAGRRMVVGFALLLRREEKRRGGRIARSGNFGRRSVERQIRIIRGEIGACVVVGHGVIQAKGGRKTKFEKLIVRIRKIYRSTRGGVRAHDGRARNKRSLDSDSPLRRLVLARDDSSVRGWSLLGMIWGGS